jgi:TusA-related sulfurtransferase
VVNTKHALDKLSGGRVEVLVDTVTSRENVLRFGANAGWTGSYEPDGNGFRVVLEK